MPAPASWARFYHPDTSNGELGQAWAACGTTTLRDTSLASPPCSIPAAGCPQPSRGSWHPVPKKSEVDQRWTSSPRDHYPPSGWEDLGSATEAAQVMVWSKTQIKRDNDDIKKRIQSTPKELLGAIPRLGALTGAAHSSDHFLF